jgi:hypothetical protein
LKPAVEGEDEMGLRRDCDRLWSGASHLWFPGQPKQPFDEYEAANRLAWEKRSEMPRTIEPDALYYTNPLYRIVNLHRSTGELTTGLTYQSPWPRSDAAGR